MASADIAAFIRSHLQGSTSQWTMGTFGAIAEFMRDPDEVAALDDLTAVTARGGIRFDDLTSVHPFASETATGPLWNHRLSLCLPTDAATMNRRTVLTELGPDRQALREEDGGAILFDMGLGTLQVDVCIRTADPNLIEILRVGAGRPVFQHGGQAMAAILAAGPHRVFITRLGRCEVYQPIPLPDGKSPDGPHTHVLPKLLAHARTHAANEPVPEGWVPCAHLIPAHPAKDMMGRAQPWSSEAHAGFQSALAAFGDQDLFHLKRRLLDAVSAGRAPESIAVPEDRFARHAVRATLRQLALIPGTPPGLTAWTALYDRQGQTDEADPLGHG